MAKPKLLKITVTLEKKRWLFNRRGYDVLVEEESKFISKGKLKRSVVSSHILSEEGDNFSIHRYEDWTPEETAKNVQGKFDVWWFSYRDGEKVEPLGGAGLLARDYPGEKCRGGALGTFGVLCFKGISVEHYSIYMAHEYEYRHKYYK